MSEFLREQALRRVALNKMLGLLGSASSHPAVRGMGNMDDWAKRLVEAHKRETDPVRRYKVLMAATGLAAYEAAWLLEAPEDDSVVLDMGTYQDWKRQDLQYRQERARR